MKHFVLIPESQMEIDYDMYIFGKILEIEYLL